MNAGQHHDTASLATNIPMIAGVNTHTHAGVAMLVAALTFLFWIWRRIIQFVSEWVIINDYYLIRWLVTSNMAKRSPAARFRTAWFWTGVAAIVPSLSIAYGLAVVRETLARCDLSTTNYWIFVALSIVGLLMGSRMRLRWWNQFRQQVQGAVKELVSLKIVIFRLLYAFLLIAMMVSAVVVASMRFKGATRLEVAVRVPATTIVDQIGRVITLPRPDSSLAKQNTSSSDNVATAGENEMQGKATLVIVRPKAWQGSFWDYSVFVNDETLGTVANGTSGEFEFQPLATGNTLTLTMGIGESEPYELRISPGERLTMFASVEVGMLSSTISLREISRSSSSPTENSSTVATMDESEAPHAESHSTDSAAATAEVTAESESSLPDDLTPDSDATPVASQEHVVVETKSGVSESPPPTNWIGSARDDFEQGRITAGTHFLAAAYVLEEKGARIDWYKCLGRPCVAVRWGVATLSQSSIEPAPTVPAFEDEEFAAWLDELTKGLLESVANQESVSSPNSVTPPPAIIAPQSSPKRLLARARAMRVDLLAIVERRRKPDELGDETVRLHIADVHHGKTLWSSAAVAADGDDAARDLLSGFEQFLGDQCSPGLLPDDGASEIAAQRCETLLTDDRYIADPLLAVAECVFFLRAGSMTREQCRRYSKELVGEVSADLFDADPRVRQRAVETLLAREFGDEFLSGKQEPR
ncbi:MAG: hypothetical protein KDA38_08020 [Planctomycetales bacterium]|nr:hypothetical protein [Planctomycetales bacterium]